MKAKKVIILSAIAIAAMVMYNCKGGSDANAMIAKKWKWESFESKAFDEQMTAIKTQADTTKDSTTKVMLQQNLAMMSGIMEAMKSTTMEFKADGSFETSMAMMGKADTKTGKWALTADGKKLLSTEKKSDGAEKTDTLSIKELTADKLVLVTPDGKGGEATVTMKAN
ncbi:MAG: hypothetical protein ACXVC6_14770 [Bacteroidia bacterium]